MSAPALPALDFVPAISDTVHVVAVDDELMLYSGGALHSLNPTATVLWQYCDGTRSLGVIVDELAEVFGSERSVIETDVLAAAVEWSDLGLIADARFERPAVEAPTAQVVTGPAGACVACEAAPDWQRISLVTVGDVQLSVGSTSSELGSHLERLFRSHVTVAEGAFPPDIRPFYGVALQQQQAPLGAPQRLHRLYRDGGVVLTSRRPARIVRALATDMATQARLGDLGPAVLPGRAVIVDGAALVVPRYPNRVAFERGVGRLGMRVVDGPAVFVDARTSELVVGAPGLDIDGEELQASADLAPPVTPLDHEPEPAAWGRYPLAGLCVAEHPSTTAALLTFAPRADDRSDPGPSLDALAVLVDSVPIFAAATLDQLEQVATEAVN